MSILIFLLVLFVLVLVHEWGHFIAAKKTGMRVDEFGIGFPPKLYGVKKGETEYTFNLFPIGGFVKIFGEDVSSVESDEDRSRSFAAKGKIQQAIVLVAGVAMNILFAWLLFVLAFSIGVQTVVPESEATEEARLMITSIVDESPAAEAGLSEGTAIVSVSTPDTEVERLTPTAFSSFIAEHAGEELTLAYSKGGEIFVTTVTPEAGIIEGEPAQPAVGIGLALIDTVSRPIHAAVIEGATLTITGLREITVGISRLLWDAVQFKADLSQVAGPVGIVGLVGEASAFGLTSLLMFTAFISLNLAIINLLPFPALDGGRLLFVAIEAVKGSSINPRYAGILNSIGFVLLILLMVAITWNDILRITG